MRRPLIVTVDEQILDALRGAAARDGVPEDELVGEALRRWFGPRGVSVLDDVGERQLRSGDRLDDEAAMELAVREVGAARAARRAAGG